MIQERVNASIITIGDELLIGQTIDTNSAWMGQQLNKAGIWIKRRIAVGDVWDDIWNALDEESNHADIVFITGGLGPTADDITKPLLCKYFAGKLVVDSIALENIKAIFSKYLNRPMLDVNLKQAEVPDVCTVLQNTRGTAPGMLFRKNETIFISLPGVPHEMKGIMTDHILPQLSTWFQLPAIVHRTLLTAGIGESFLAERIKEFEINLPENVKLAYLPNYGMVRLRLTCSGENKDAVEAIVDKYFVELQSQLQDVMAANEDIDIEEAVGRLLAKKGKTLTTAESCTGGFIAHLVTKVPGSSAYFKGGVVSYANEIKESLLGVQETTLQQHGAVSEATVKEMAEGALHKMGTDYVIAVSGIMGPGGGTIEKPIGTVWIAVANKEKVVGHQMHFRFDRQRNIEMTAMNALMMLRTLLLED